MRRKAWFIMPLGWDRIIKDGKTVVDMGCGDGDTVQRFINLTQKIWSEEGITDRCMHVVGIDLNYSRIENAKKHVKSPSPNITVEFLQGDVVGDGLSYDDSHFDYALCTGVLEILDDSQFNKFLNEMCRITNKGIYIEDLFEEFPGEYPRDDFSSHLNERGYKIKDRHVIFSEPFDIQKIRAPKKLWPILLDQNIFAVRK